MKSSQAILLSIVIPLHNRAAEIQQMLASIPSRQDIEIIVVNDHSEKQIPFLNHGRVIFRSLPEGQRFAGVARNFGLNQAEGKWICFADSDDLFETEELVSLLDRIHEEDADIIFFKAKSFMHNGGEGRRHRSINRLFMVAKEGNKNSLLNWHPPWSKVFKKSFLDKHEIVFSATRVSNDVIFSLKSFLAASKISYRDEVFYKVRQGNESLTTRQNFKDLVERLEIVNEYNCILQAQNLHYFMVPAIIYLRFILFINPVFFIKNMFLFWSRKQPVFFTLRNLVMLLRKFKY